MADSVYVPQIDYTSRDYLAIRQDLIGLIPSFAPKWTNRDPADFGMTLIELFSYMGDMLGYYIDRAANESFITTATQRESILSLAGLLGYTPTSITAATTTLTFSNSSTTTAITVPAKTKVTNTAIVNGTTLQVFFETDYAVVVPVKVGAIDGTISVSATQGKTVTEILTTNSSGQISQTYQLSQANVVTDSMTVDVSGVPYTVVDHIIDYSGYDAVFSHYVDGNNVTYVQFGDGNSGRIPPSTTTITITYRVCDGANGNLNAGTLTTIHSVPVGPVPVGIKVTNLIASTGGADYESTDSIRYNAPISIKAINRAVTLSDYASLAVGVTGIYKAIAVGDVYTNITLYFVPQGDTGLDQSGNPSTVFNTRATTLDTYFQDKKPANTTLTFAPAAYVPVNIILKVTLLPITRQTVAITAINAAINKLFDVTRTYFNQRVTMQDVYNAVSLVAGVQYVQVVKLVRNDQDLSYTLIKKEYTATGNVATVTTGTTAKVTAASSNGTTVTYTAANTFTAGQKVTVTNLSTSAFNLSDVTIATASSTQFTVTNGATGTAVTGASGTAYATVPHSLQVGQTIQIGGIDSTFNGTFVVTGVPTTTPANTTFTYRLLAGASNIPSALLSTPGATTLIIVNDVVCDPQEIPTLNTNVFSIQSSGGINN